MYWGQELRLGCQVQPLDYTPDEKQYQSMPISPEDVINYCLSTLNMTSSGEIYNLHAIIVDKNYENYKQRTCQPLAIELARMFSSSGCVKKRILKHQINNTKMFVHCFS